MAALRYLIVVDGELDPMFAPAFVPAEVSVDTGRTRIQTTAIDQPALHGLLTRLSELRLTLLSVDAS